MILSVCDKSGVAVIVTEFTLFSTSLDAYAEGT